MSDVTPSTSSHFTCTQGDIRQWHTTGGIRNGDEELRLGGRRSAERTTALSTHAVDPRRPASISPLIGMCLQPSLVMSYTTRGTVQGLLSKEEIG